MWKEAGKKPIGEYILFTFAISWIIEGVIIILERFEKVPISMQKPLVMLLIGLGAGMAPAYATFIILKRHKKIKGIRDFLKRIIWCVIMSN